MLERRTCNRLPNQYFANGRKKFPRYVTNSDAEFVFTITQNARVADKSSSCRKWKIRSICQRNLISTKIFRIISLLGRIPPLSHNVSGGFILRTDEVTTPILVASGSQVRPE